MTDDRVGKEQTSPLPCPLCGKPAQGGGVPPGSEQRYRCSDYDCLPPLRASLWQALPRRLSEERAKTLIDNYAEAIELVWEGEDEDGDGTQAPFRALLYALTGGSRG